MGEPIIRECEDKNCSNTFELGPKKKQQVKRFCSQTCAAHSHPAYVKNTRLIEIAEFWLSLNFTPEQVWSDHLEGIVLIHGWVRTLERRKLLKLAQRFRPMDDSRNATATAERHDAAAAA